MSEPRARVGWESDFPEFSSVAPREIREALREFVTDASPEQVRAWTDAIPPLQAEVQEILVRDELARRYSAILEYELPMEARRPDVILLVGAVVVVVELKGKTHPSQADVDQVAAYARDLRCYHRECADRPVVPVIVPTRARGYQQLMDGVHVAGPDALDAIVSRLSREHPTPLVDRERFLAESAYRPLPTLVEAARELFHSGEMRVIHRARAATEPAVDEISRIVHQAALTRSRHLILVTGLPGAGKTLVGLRTVHARYLDDLIVPRADGKPTTPAAFLSGNGPLVEVLQYELAGAGGGGKAFVRGVKDYVTRYSSRPEAVPPEHVLVFDEAQRAFDAQMMAMKHGARASRSEPEQFVEFADRIPEWGVVVGLIGSGQEIHVGEEGGIGQWRAAVEGSGRSSEWTVHAPPGLASHFAGSRVPLELRPSLNLDVELRYHLAPELHAYVDGLLTDAHPVELVERARRLDASGFHLRISRSFEQAKHYLRERYAEDRDARFGIVASSKDRHLVDFGIPNDFQSTKRVRVGPWYGDPEDGYTGQSCRLLETCVTEFGAQGLELDATLLAWGTDFRRDGGRWSNALARGYLRRAMVRDPFTLRRNAYRVLLTRGRDACVTVVPQSPLLDETYSYLLACGWRSIGDDPSASQRP